MNEMDGAVIEAREPDGPAMPAPDAPSYVFTLKLKAATDPDSMVSESIRSLRTLIMAQHIQAGRRSLAICAPTAGAGCSFLAANLAMAMADIKVNTLLIDGNLRDPSIHEYISPSEQVTGLADLLSDDTLPLGGTISPIAPSLSVLYAGNQITTGREQIGGDLFRSVMGSCIRDFDLTIIDTPPANRYADTRRIASVARYALVVACRERSNVRDVRTLIDEFETDHTSVLGTYLNDY